MIGQYPMPLEYYWPLSSSLRLVTGRTNIEAESTRTLVIPSSIANQRGAIVYGSIALDVLVLFDFKMQNDTDGRCSCKVLPLKPRLGKDGTFTWAAHIQNLLSGVNNYIVENGPDNEAVEHHLAKLHDHYTSGSNSRTSFVYLSQDIYVGAIISPHVVDGQVRLSLAIESRKLSEVECPFAEMATGIELSFRPRPHSWLRMPEDLSTLERRDDMERVL
jgi:hypothetical protein